MPKKTHDHATHHQEGFISNSTKRSMNKNEKIIMGVLVGGIVLFLLLSVIVLFGKGKGGFGGSNTVGNDPTNSATFTPYPTIPPIKNMTVILNERRFNPQTATIPVGGFVNFLNFGDKTLTIEANDENSKVLNLGAIESTEDKVVTFNTPGTYTYRDKSNPSRVGVVIVK